MTTINHEVNDLLQHEPEFEAAEGYHTTEVLMLNDCDHGPCLGHTFDNGWIMYTYINDPSKISFHYAGTPDEEDDPDHLTSYDVCVIAEVSEWIKVSAIDEDSAETQALELFAPAIAHPQEIDAIRTLEIKETTTHE